MFSILLIYFLIVAFVIIAKYLIAKKSITTYGELEVKIISFVGNQKIKNVLTSLLGFALSIACVLFFYFYPEYVKIPNWIFAILCGIVGGRFLSILFDDMIFEKGFYKKGILLDNSVITYNQIIKHSIKQDKKNNKYIELKIPNNKTKEFYVDDNDISKAQLIIMANRGETNNE